MAEFFRKYWFVSVLSVLFIGVLLFFVSDMNKDSVKSKQVDGKDIIASTTVGNVTSDDLFKQTKSTESSVLFSMYRNAVTDQSIETTDEIKKTAKEMQEKFELAIKSDSTGKTKASINSQLASFGFAGDSALADYCLIASKIQLLDGQFIKDHIDQLTSYVPENARTVSVITMEVENADELTDEQKQKQADIQSALDAGEAFADVAVKYSEQEDAAKTKGFVGYVDANSTDLDSSVLEAVNALKKGESTDWISVSNGDTYTLYKAYVDETDPAALLESEDSAITTTLVNNIISSANGLETLVILNASQDLEISYANDDIKTSVEEYMDSQIDNLDEKLKAIADEIRGTKADSKTETSSETASETSTEQEGE
ncbi:MAG: peptidylprolyl isomerase [Erysipelotrichaceae bacterium]|nr:peptidylprolyl isomerase [Erysipelotrichaceae bacterium]